MNENIDSGFKKNRRWHSGFTEFVMILLIAFLIRTIGYGLYRVPTGSMETTMLVGELFFADKFSVLFSSPCHGDIISFNDPLFTYSENKVMQLFQSFVWGPSNWTKRIIGVPGDVIEGKIEYGKPVIYRNGKRLIESYLNKYPLIGVWKINRKIDETMQDDDEYVEDQWSFKSYDPSKAYEEQPWYKLNQHAIMVDQTGKPIMRLPGSPWIKERNNGELGKNFWNGSDEFFVKLEQGQYWVMGDNRLNSHDSRAFGPLERHLIHGRIIFRLLSIDSAASWMMVEMLRHPLDFWHSFRWDRCIQRVA
jgi:signal peptidase I